MVVVVVVVEVRALAEALEVVRWNIVIRIAMFYVSTVAPYEVRLGREDEVMAAHPRDGVASGLSLRLASRRQKSRASVTIIAPVARRTAPPRPTARAHRYRS